MFFYLLLQEIATFLGFLNNIITFLFLIFFCRNQKKSNKNQHQSKNVSQSPHSNQGQQNTNKKSRNIKGHRKAPNTQNKIKENKNNKTALNTLNPNSKRGFKKRIVPKLSSSNSMSTAAGQQMTNSKQQRIVKRFKGANQKVVSELSVGRLAAYGLDKRKKQSKSESTA